MTDDGLGAWLTRGTSAIRADARRALDELVSRGDLSAEEASRLEEAVKTAIERSSEFVSSNLMTPLRELLDSATAPIRSAVGHDADVSSLQTRLDALDARLARIERRLEERDA